MTYVFIDLDSGTVFNGPLYEVPAHLVPEDATDDEYREIAKEHGVQVI